MGTASLLQCGDGRQVLSNGSEVVTPAGRGRGALITERQVWWTGLGTQAPQQWDCEGQGGTVFMTFAWNRIDVIKNETFFMLYPLVFLGWRSL